MEIIKKINDFEEMVIVNNHKLYGIPGSIWVVQFQKKEKKYLVWDIDMWTGVRVIRIA